MQCGDPQPVVIAINSTDQLLQNAAFQFNREFLQNLTRDEKSIKESYALARDVVAASDQAADGSCCCVHDHKPGCLFIKYMERHGLTQHEACQRLHKNSCNCYEKIIERQRNDLELVGKDF